MRFLIQSNLMGSDQLEQVRYAVRHLPHQMLELKPFSDELDPVISKDDTDIIPYGSTLLTTLGYTYFNWKGLFFELSDFSYKSYLQNREDMLNDGLVVTIEKAISILKACPKNQEWFVRPSLDLKQFSGIVIEAEECANWFVDAVECDSSGTYRMEPNTEVVIAEPKSIQAEWRWFVVGGKVISGSIYRLRGRLIKDRETDTEVIRDAQKLANKWLPHECCVMDTSLVGGELKVTEFNCINSSGFYDHDVGLIFKEIFKYSSLLK